MTHWNHRIMAHRDADGHLWFDVREVYYDEDRIEGWTIDAIAAVGDTADEVAACLAQMLAARKRPVLQEWELPGYDGP